MPLILAPYTNWHNLYSLDYAFTALAAFYFSLAQDTYRHVSVCIRHGFTPQSLSLKLNPFVLEIQTFDAPLLVPNSSTIRAKGAY